MGTIRYAAPTGSNTSPYDTWAKAATNPQTIIDLAVAGDENRYKGTFTLAAIIDVDTNAGVDGTGYVNHVGYNTSEALDGTRAIFDANSAVDNCINGTVAGHIWTNFQFKNALVDGINLSNAAADEWVLNNCEIDNNGANGCLINVGVFAMLFFRCLIHNNTNDGINTGGSVFVMGCAIYANGDSGIESSYAGPWILSGNAIYDNGDNDPNVRCSNIFAINNVIDGTNQTGEIGIQLYSDFGNYLIMNRITNLATGIDFSDEVTVYGFNLFHNNTNDIINNLASGTNLLYLDAVTDTNKYDPDADDGYNNAATADYNLKSDRTYNGDGTDLIDMNVGS